MGPYNTGLFEAGYDLVNAFHETDCNAADVNGDYVKVRDFWKVGVLFIKGGAEDVDDLAISLTQATSAAGGSAKALTAFYGARGWYKSGAFTSQNTWTEWTEVTTADDAVAFGATVPAGSTRVIADTGTTALQIYTEFETTALDADGAFDWLRVNALGSGNVNNACLISAWYVLIGNRYPQKTPLTNIA